MATTTIPIAQSSDDAHEAGNGNVFTNAGNHTLSGGSHWGGFRFVPPVNLKGATINSVVLRINLPHASFVTASFDIYCQAHDNGPTFTASNNDLSGRSLTTAKTPWSATLSMGTHDTPNFAAAVTEVINRAGWANGNSIVVIFDALAGVSFRYDTFDGTTFTPELIIDYTPATANYNESVTLTAERVAGVNAQAGAAGGMALGRAQTASGPGMSAANATAVLIRELELLLAATDSGQKWWEPSSGAFSVAGVYRAIGAASASAARVNLDNPGTNDLTTPGAAPSWAIETGWTLNGTSQFFATGLSSNGDYTMIVRFSDVGDSDDRVLIGGVGSGADTRHWTSPRWFANQAGIGYGNAFTVAVTATGWAAGGVLAVSRNKLYRDGSLIHTLSGTFSGGAAPLFVGAFSNNGTAANFFPGKIQAVAIYNSVLSDSQVAEVSAAMAALTDSPVNHFSEAIALLAALGVVPVAMAGGVSDMALDRELSTTGAAAAGALDAAALLRALDVGGDEAVGASADLTLAMLPQMVATGALSLLDAIALAIEPGITAVDGRAILEAVVLGRVLAAASSEHLSGNVGLTLALARALSADETTALAAAVSLFRDHGVFLTPVAGLHETAALGVVRSADAAAGLLLAETLALAIGRGVDVADALGRAEAIALARAAGVITAETVGIGAAMALAIERDMTADALAEMLAGLQLERVDAAEFGPLAGLTEVIGLSVYRAMVGGDEVNIIITHRHIFIVDRENRLFVIEREKRAFAVKRGS